MRKRNMSNGEIKKGNIKVNYIYNLAYDILILIIPLITTPYIARVLSTESVGIYSFTYANVQYFTAFVALGTKSYAIKRISRAKNRLEASYAFWDTFILRAISGTIALAAYYAYAYFFTESFLICAVQSVYIIAVIFDISWFFQGVENFRTIILRNAVFKILTLIAIFVFVKDDSDLIIYMLALSGLTFLGNASLWGYLPRHLVRIEKSKIRPFTGFSEILVLFIPTLALQIYAAVDKTVLGITINDMSQNGYYEQASKITHLFFTFITSLAIVALPRISSLFAQRKTEQVRGYMQKSYRFVLMLSLPLTTGMLSVSGILVEWFLGEKYLACIPLLNVFSILYIVVGLSNISGFQYLVATDRQNYYSMSIVAGTVANIIMNLILIPSYAALGAVIASVISETLVLVIQMVYIIWIKRELTLFDFFGTSWRYWIGAGVMYGALWLMRGLHLSGFWGLVIAAVSGALIYFAIILILRDDMVIGYAKSLINRLKKIRKRA